MWRNLETANLVTFTEEILNGKLDFLCSVVSFYTPRKPLFFMFSGVIKKASGMKWVKNKTIDQTKNDPNLVLRIGRTNVALKNITLYLHSKNDQITSKNSKKTSSLEKSTNLVFHGNYHNFSSYFYFKLCFHINELQTF